MEWVSLIDKQPEEDCEVIVYAEPGFIYLASRDGSGWLRHTGAGAFPLTEKRRVTHWMHLPKPPIDERQAAAIEEMKAEAGPLDDDMLVKEAE